MRERSVHEPTGLAFSDWRPRHRLPDLRRPSRGAPLLSPLERLGFLPGERSGTLSDLTRGLRGPAGTGSRAVDVDGDDLVLHTDEKRLVEYDRPLRRLGLRP